MLTIEIKINGHLIGGAKVRNVSALSDISDYEALVVEKGDEALGIEGDLRESVPVKGHIRNQSVWALVYRIADAAFRRQRDLGRAVSVAEVNMEEPDSVG